MLKKNWGRIIFISSESAQHIPPEMIHYGMTKTAQGGRRSRFWRKSVAGTGVTVNSILAGPHRFRRPSVTLSKAWPSSRASRKPKIEKQFFFHRSPLFALETLRNDRRSRSRGRVSLPARRQLRSMGSAVRAEGGVIRSIF